MREFLDGESIICFADTRADAGETLDRADVAQDRTPRPAATTRPSPPGCPTRPRADEIVVVAAASTGPRPHARIGDRTDRPVPSPPQALEEHPS